MTRWLTDYVYFAVPWPCATENWLTFGTSDTRTQLCFWRMVPNVRVFALHGQIHEVFNGFHFLIVKTVWCGPTGLLDDQTWADGYGQMAWRRKLRHLTKVWIRLCSSRATGGRNHLEQKTYSRGFSSVWVLITLN